MVGLNYELKGHSRESGRKDWSLRGVGGSNQSFGATKDMGCSRLSEKEKLRGSKGDNRGGIQWINTRGKTIWGLIPTPAFDGKEAGYWEKEKKPLVSTAIDAQGAGDLICSERGHKRL